MGNMENQTSFSINKHPYNWKTISTTDSYQIVVDAETHTQGQRYILHPQHLQREINLYQFRNNHSQYIPQVLTIQPLYTNDICAQSVSLNVVIERIPFRLVDLGHLGFAEGLYILERVLRGGQQIFRNIGSIHYDDTMICFSVAGKPKIWINENLSKNQSEISVKLSEKEIVLEIMTILQTRMGGNKFRTYMDQKRLTPIQNFKTAIDFIQEMKEKDGTLISSIILPSTSPPVDLDRQKQSIITSEGNNFKSTIKYQTPQKQLKSIKSSQHFGKHQKGVASLMKPPTIIKKSLSPYRFINEVPKNRGVLTQMNVVNRIQKIPSKMNMKIPPKSPYLHSPRLSSMKQSMSRLDEEVKKVTRRQLLADEYRLYSYG